MMTAQTCGCVQAYMDSRSWKPGHQKARINSTTLPDLAGRTTPRPKPCGGHTQWEELTSGCLKKHWLGTSPNSFGECIGLYRTCQTFL